MTELVEKLYQTSDLSDGELKALLTERIKARNGAFVPVITVDRR